MIGSQLSHYRLTGKLGEGGMGVVYRAEDARLDREVALKVLPEGAVASVEALARFEQEARVLASLSHPNVAVVHDVGEHEGTHFLVMELVEGPTLDQRLEQGPLGVAAAIAVADQIADGLEAAHEQGIVHRDLKPQNVKISDSDRIKLLDFGLAKALGGEPMRPASGRPLTQSPTLGLDATAAGRILGTAAYMSPEQAKGVPVDKRADVWAFGVVLYEMLTGEPLFRAETAPEILAQVLTASPSFEKLPGETPPALRRLLERCLRREPRSRLRDLGDARLELMAALDELEHPPEAAPGRPAVGRSGPAAVVTALVALAIAGAAGLAGWLIARSGAGSRTGEEQLNYRVTLPRGERFALDDSSVVASSPDRRLLAFTVRGAGEQESELQVHSLVTGETRALEGTSGARHPAFSPDSRELAFFADRALWRMPVAGGLRTRLADASNPRGVDWSADGSIVFSPEFASGLYRLDVATGEIETLRLPDPTREERTYRWPDVDPSGRFVLYTVGFQQAASDYSAAEVALAGLDGSGGAVLIEAASMARFASTDRILFARGDRLFTVGLDPGAGRVVGSPVPVAGEIGGDPGSGVVYFSNNDRDVVYVPDNASKGRYRLVIVDLESGLETVPALPEQIDLVTGRVSNPTFSPDGRRVMFLTGSQLGDSWEISLEDDSLQRLTFSDGRAGGAVYEPNGKYVLYRQEGEGVLRKSTDGRGAPERIVPEPPDRLLNVWSPAVTEGGPLVLDDVQAQEVLLARVGGVPELYERQAVNPTISPDGRWVAFTSLETGSPTVVVRPVEGEGRWQVSPSVGSRPRWAADGTLLFFYDLTSTPWDLVRVSVSPVGESFRFGRPVLVMAGIAGRFDSTLLGFNFDISPSGDRAVFVEIVHDEAERDEIVVLHDWDLPGGASGSR